MTVVLSVDIILVIVTILQEPLGGGGAALKMPKAFPFPQSPKIEESTSGSPLQVLAGCS